MAYFNPTSRKPLNRFWWHFETTKVPLKTNSMILIRNMGGVGQNPVCHCKVSCFVFGLHRMHSIDAIYCDRRSTVIIVRDIVSLMHSPQQKISNGIKANAAVHCTATDWPVLRQLFRVKNPTLRYGPTSKLLDDLFISSPRTHQDVDPFLPSPTITSLPFS